MYIYVCANTNSLNVKTFETHYYSIQHNVIMVKDSKYTNLQQRIFGKNFIYQVSNTHGNKYLYLAPQVTDNSLSFSFCHTYIYLCVYVYLYAGSISPNILTNWTLLMGFIYLYVYCLDVSERCKRQVLFSVSYAWWHGFV